MIEEIIKLRGDGLSFRKIASELNTTVGKVQYRWNKWIEENNNEITDELNRQSTKDSNSSDDSISPELIPQKGELKARLITPRKIILFWDISELPKKIIERFFNRKFEELVTVTRIYDVTNILFNGKNAHHYNEITVPYQSGHWFIKGLSENRSYVAELGVHLSDNQFFPLYRSNCIQMPSPEILSGNTFQQELLQFHRYEEESPKWVEQVSTYSYYVKSNNLGEHNG
ncbi:hypothetical protein FB550_102470 [Neobacillus bataviensis]|uniref:DUF4912 domain-containing protein n=1 Tax=Neobacillus bataviensis TaxID=220685 RepID=A0A561DSV6_9BACI|nr:DUF4912 domain-containing protein [Neobacillus bataviensis]TWE06448.1 hypothetical protein FB550_102470 [Neobacillus bataviensis]